MSHFEYIFVAVSIILSFTLLRVLDALPFALNRQRGYWVHGVWVCFLLYLCATYWWISWHNRNFELTLRYFLFLLLAPSVLFLTATALVSAAPASVESWRAHFFQVRPRFFGGLLVYFAMLFLNSFVTFELPLRHPIRYGQAAVLVLVLAGLALPTARGQAVVGGLAAATLAAFVTLALADRAPLSFD